ncbi:MAG: hypothetical protein KAQ92_05940 [Candidatus Aenigmarchaeota archaeon]|nr:hypothetical protein [Candidatus Aenigmarchaeota archaeon]
MKKKDLVIPNANATQTAMERERIRELISKEETINSYWLGDPRIGNASMDIKLN